MSQVAVAAPAGPPRPRSAVARLAPTRPPGAGKDMTRLVRLGSNESAFGPAPIVLDAFVAAGAGLNRYPDSEGLALREALAAAYRLTPANVVLGSGADELIRLTALAVLEPGATAVFPWPSFPSYLDSTLCCDGRPVRLPLTEVGAVDVDAMIEAATTLRARLVYVANPNNPTGATLAHADLHRLVDGLPGDTLCVVDEAYAELAEPEPRAAHLLHEGAERLCVLRTFSKVYGLASLRVGYALAPASVAAWLQRLRPVHNVSGPAQAAALAALHDRETMRFRVAQARMGRERLAAMLAAAGMEPLPSQANFVCARVPGADASEVARTLLAAGVLVRPLGGFGAPDALRVTVGSPGDLDVLEAALGQLAGPGAG